MVDREVEKEEEEGGSSTSCAAHLCLQVYLLLEGVGAKCSRQCSAGAEAGEGLQPVSWELGVRQVSLRVRGYKEGRTLLFEVKRLGGDIVPEACTFKSPAYLRLLTELKAPIAYKALVIINTPLCRQPLQIDLDRDLDQDLERSKPSKSKAYRLTRLPGVQAPGFIA
ncbi:hypothetical protein QJQ45_004616 [Haematococcus lacustris]|nr:hypothetical protein QJQ45_004616 [Haematococcus lacustris]